MKLTVSRTYEEDPQTVRRRLDGMDARLQSKYGAKTEWVDDSTMRIGAPGVKGQLRIAPRQVVVDLDISLMLRPLRGRIEQQVGKELDQVLHQAA